MNKEESKDEIIDTIETEFIKQKPERVGKVVPEISGRNLSAIKKSNRNLYSTQLSSTISGILRTDAMTSDVLVLGLSYSGKSLLIRRLNNLDKEIEADTQPTVGTDIIKIKREKKEVLVRELVASWIKFSLETRIIMFVVDMTNPLDLAASAVEFFNILITTSTNETPIFLVLNKIDCDDLISLQTIERFFKIRKLMEFRKNVQVFLTSAFLGANVKNLMDSIVDVLNFLKPYPRKSKKSCCF